MSTTVVSSAKLPVIVPSLINEVANTNGLWNAHYNQVHYTGNWDVLPLRSPGGNTAFSYAETMNHGQFQDTAYLNSFPAIRQLLQQFNCPLLSARLLNLKAGSVIKKHRDFDLSFEHGEARLHFPIITNDKVSFYLNDKLLPMQAGECWYINANLPHNAINAGDTDRIHLVVDCVVNDWLKDLFERAEKSYYTYPTDTNMILRMIEELKANPSPAAQGIIDELEEKYRLLSETN
ncbi:aspartyl/asparaginyl beta-hydroxylase domain-containing protein [Mucilaginibacter sp. RS28]|uniref:Aspartyl/asparaginyl beta-hydroxylase domain-containing protein n=1 Tax=Mucilaginibacter straminoryzae TaxID=2932774 RepID=A0A9X1X5I3_9SPHI|nr:aspartyl/asparaginyl beta-hydroxylase domain-containing protein [Mucilaginibacter straminoryzae]MCJ8211346.1 aspartyl/asparaginyl beta-hydroxylase domain-containing protein [Mucilaginibacter straminoryzae]